MAALGRVNSFTSSCMLSCSGRQPPGHQDLACVAFTPDPVELCLPRAGLSKAPSKVEMWITMIQGQQPEKEMSRVKKLKKD